MAQELCTLKKDLKGNLTTYILLVNQPQYICTSCGRVANKKKNLCNPEAIPKQALCKRLAVG